MPKVQYFGSADEYSFSKGDFTSHGVEDQGAVKFNLGNKFVAEVSDSAASFLTNEFPNDFKLDDGSDSTKTVAPTQEEVSRAAAAAAPPGAAETGGTRSGGSTPRP